MSMVYRIAKTMANKPTHPRMNKYCDSDKLSKQNIIISNSTIETDIDAMAVYFNRKLDFSR